MKVVYVISNVNHALAFEWIAASINKDEFDLSFVLLNPAGSELQNNLEDIGVPVKLIRYKGKGDILKAIWKLYWYFKRIKPDVVHSHLVDAAICGLFAAKWARVPNRVQSRHHSTFNHVYHPHAVIYDRWANNLSTTIVAVSAVVEDVLINKEGVNQKKIQVIHHGFDLNKFEDVPEEHISALKQKYHTQDHTPVVGVISRYTQWKGVQYIIPAFKDLLTIYPNALLFLANAGGDYENEIKSLLEELPAKNFIEVPFEKDLYALYKLFDIFVHVPIDDHSEAFGQIYIEALASGVPSIFTLSGIAKEVVDHETNALIVDHKSSNSIYESMVRLLSDQVLREHLKHQGGARVTDQFKLKNMIDALERSYKEMTI